MDNPFKSPAVLSICTGIRGLERGVERAIGPVRTIAYVEIESFIIENLLVGMEKGLLDAAPIWANLKTFNPKPFRGKVHGIVGGYPCQPFSTAGKRKGVEDPRHLWPHIVRCIRAIKPVWCFFENVSGHLTLGFEEVAESLRAMGYAVEAGLYTAEEVGAPHQRKRLFILAILADATSLRKWGRIGHLCEKDGGQVGGLFFEPDSSSKNVDDSSGDRSESKHQISAGRYGAESSGKNMGNAHYSDRGEIDTGRIGRDEDNIYEEGEEGAIRPQRASKELANGVSSGFQTDGLRTDLMQREENGQGVWTGIERSGDRWPARPGEQQFEWEEPRTIEPGVGVTIDGYNFRQDLLRSLGNGVVEQQAAFAIIRLLLKHQESLKRSL